MELSGLASFRYRHWKFDSHLDVLNAGISDKLKSRPAFSHVASLKLGQPVLSRCYYVIELSWLQTELKSLM